METHRFLRRKAASGYLHKTFGLDRAPSTLAKLAVIGGGPPFRRMNRVPLYAEDDLNKWVASKLSAPMRSTSDTAASKSDITDACHQADPSSALNLVDGDADEKSSPSQRRAVS
jgi:hypothetical protein